MKPIYFTSIAAGLCLAACADQAVSESVTEIVSETPISETSSQALTNVSVVTPDELEFIPLNPARGDAAPQAGVLWGDIREDVATGTLLRFADGFSSPPHIHNITYRGVVISGQMHNDDPDAANMWMGPGSFWTQPAGEVHITSAKEGAPATAFLEILEGPYLVNPPEDAFENGELPINLASSNIVWLDANDMKWIDSEKDNGASISILWGDTDMDTPSGSMIKLEPGFSGTLSVAGSDLRAVVIAGEFSLTGVDGAVPAESYFSLGEYEATGLGCDGGEACLLYISTNGQYRID